MDDLRRRSFDVSIHAPREGCDATNANTDATKASFNSRTPGGVRHQAGKSQQTEIESFNSRTPGGVRHPEVGVSKYQAFGFNSRTPGGVRLDNKRAQTRYLNVSIHAPREGCDICKISLFLLKSSFNSRTPGGVRLRLDLLLVRRLLFQFTHPGRGATHYGVDVPRGRGEVSIHAPREGCDCDRAKSLSYA